MQISILRSQLILTSDLLFNVLLLGLNITSLKSNLISFTIFGIFNRLQKLETYSKLTVSNNDPVRSKTSRRLLTATDRLVSVEFVC